MIAFDSIFKKYYPILCAYGNRFVDYEESKEIAGDAILWLWEHRETLQVETSLGRYLLKSVYHRSLNCIKQKQLKNHADTMYYEEMEKLIHDAETYQFQELSKRVKEAIDALPASYREAFVMHRFTKKSYKEIAESSGVSVKTIAYRIQQATKLLTNYYDRLCIVSRSLTIAQAYLLLKKRTFLKKEYLISQGML